MFYLMNENISDGMIEDNAKIWCIFRDTDVSKALDEVIAQTKQKASEEAEGSSESERLDETGKVRAGLKIGSAAGRSARKTAGRAAGRATGRAARKSTVKTAEKTAAGTARKTAEKTISTGKKLVAGAKTTGKTIVVGAKTAEAGAAGYGAYKIHDYLYGDGDASKVKINDDGTADIKSWDEASFKD